MKNMKLLIAVASLSLLSACGGGGSSGGGTPAPVASTSAFNLQAAYKSNYTASASYKISVTGTYGAYPVTGSATAVQGNVTSGTFEGKPALQQAVSILGTITVNNQTGPLATSSISWVDTNYMPLGTSGGSEYIVVNGTASIPTAAKVNDTGAVYTAKRYTTSAKTSLLGTRTVTYVVEADTATTALVTLISVDKNNSGTTTVTATEQYRVTTANTFTKIKETGVDNTNGLSLTLTVIY
jgi:hypothetical protein